MRKAFTLVELLVVVVILGILAALIVPRVFGRVGGAKQGVARANLKIIETKVMEFQADCGRLPTQQEGLRVLIQQPADCGTKWKGPYLKEKEIIDPWDAPYVYLYPPRHNNDFDLVSYGADKQEGGEDENEDIGNW